jgi:hypothetical protein
MGRSCECFARGPRSLHNVIDLAALERVDRTLWSIEKGKLLFQEAPCSARFRKNLEYSVDPWDQFAGTQDLFCRNQCALTREAPAKQTSRFDPVVDGGARNNQSPRNFLCTDEFVLLSRCFDYIRAQSFRNSCLLARGIEVRRNCFKCAVTATLASSGCW